MRQLLRLVTTCVYLQDSKPCPTLTFELDVNFFTKKLLPAPVSPRTKTMPASVGVGRK
jgi:hypothetical protein